MFLHESQYLEPVMRDIEAMLQESQRNVNGTAILELRPLSFSTVGVESQDDLVKTKFGEYGECKGLDGRRCKGFIKVTSTHYVFTMLTIRTKRYDKSRNHWWSRIYSRRTYPPAYQSSETEIVFINSTSNAGNKITDVHEGLYGECDLAFTDELPLEDIDVLFFCTAMGIRRNLWKAIISGGTENYRPFNGLSHSFTGSMTSYTVCRN